MSSAMVSLLTDGQRLQKDTIPIGKYLIDFFIYIQKVASLATYLNPRYIIVNKHYIIS